MKRLGLFCCILALAVPWAKADVMVELDFGFAGVTPSSDASPWLTAVFEDAGTDTVRLTMAAANLTGTEFVKGWYFNLHPFMSIAATYESGVEADSVSLGFDRFKAGGNGWFDFLFKFPTANKNRFTGGLESVYVLTGTGLSAASFSALASGPPKTDGFASVAHVLNTGKGGEFSGWIASRALRAPEMHTPEPGSFVLLGTVLGLAGVLLHRRRTRNRAS